MRRHELLFDFAEWLAAPPSGGVLQKWLVGMGLAMMLALYGLKCCLTQTATTLRLGMRGFEPSGRGWWLEHTGFHAVTFGFLILSVGLFVHFHFFWGHDHRLFRFHGLAKVLAALGVIAAMLSHIFTLITRT